MNTQSKKNVAISPTRDENYPLWYQEVIRVAELAEHSPVRGCMVIKPWGYGVWENMQRILDRKLKDTGHQNAYFPLFVPLSFFEKEAEHVEGFAKECAVVTHHRLERDAEGKLSPAGLLEEPLIVRPTSEILIGETFSKWISSYRDLPLKINQWANVIRWEMRTRLFLRTMEFLWQEGHTAHTTAEEAIEEAVMILDLYQNFIESTLAIPVVRGKKTVLERFPGAVETYTLEAMMQDKKALQAATSHFLGQNFARASNIRFRDKAGHFSHVWTTSWGATTRLIGAMIMTHADDNGMILPPRVATAHLVIVPVLHRDTQRNEVLAYCRNLADRLRSVNYGGASLSIIIDESDMRGGDKEWRWIKKGIPLRLEIGPKELAKGQFQLKRRDWSRDQSIVMVQEELIEKIPFILDEMQQALYEKALAFKEINTVKIDSKEEFYRFFTPENKEHPEIHGGFALSHWCGDEEVEKKVKEDLGVSIRCIPCDLCPEEGYCIITGKKSRGRVIYAKSY